MSNRILAEFLRYVPEAIKFSLVSKTDLGKPVVPLVNKIKGIIFLTMKKHLSTVYKNHQLISYHGKKQYLNYLLFH